MTNKVYFCLFFAVESSPSLHETATTRMKTISIKLKLEHDTCLFNFHQIHVKSIVIHKTKTKEKLNA